MAYEKKMHILAASGAILIGGFCSAFAETYEFSIAGGDLADLSAWQTLYPSLTELPGSSDYVRLWADSTFTMSKDMTVGRFSFAFRTVVLDFASSGNHTLKVVGDESYSFCAHNGTIRGGVIDRDGKNMLWFQNDGYETVVTDGCVITNCTRFYVNVWKTSKGTLRLLDGSRLHADSLALNNGEAGTVSGGTRLEVADGAQAYLSGANNYSDLYSKEATSGGNVLDVHGNGSCVDMVGCYINGYHSHSNVLRVADGATFSAQELFVGYTENGATTKGNRLIVDGGTVKTKGNIVATGDGVVFSLTNAMVEVNNGAGIFSCATNTVVDIVDSVLKCAKFRAAPGLNLHVAGANTEFSTGENWFGMDASGMVGNRVCFDNGFNWCPSIGYGYYFMHTSTNCELTVKNGAIFSAWRPADDTYDTLVFGGVSATSHGAENVVRALSDGEILGRNVWLTGIKNEVVISNGLVSAVGQAVFGYNEWANGNRVTLQGAKPRIRAEKCTIGHGTTLRFEIPETGYASDSVPLVCTGGFALTGASNAFEVDVGRFVPEKTTQLTLAQFGADLTADQQAWFKGAVLPERYRIEVLNGREVVLKARCAPKGFAISVR